MAQERKSGQSADPPEGRYANYFKIGYNAFELIIDCGQCYADDAAPQLHTRIITSPAYGKALLKTLSDSLEEYEKNYGRGRMNPGAIVIVRSQDDYLALPESGSINLQG